MVGQKFRRALLSLYRSRRRHRLLLRLPLLQLRPLPLLYLRLLPLRLPHLRLLPWRLHQFAKVLQHHRLHRPQRQIMRSLHLHISSL